jgi:hypothetical protein
MDYSMRLLNRVLLPLAVVGVSLFLPICTSSGSAIAQDCNAAFTQITLLSQGNVDDFQSVYGPCDRIGGSLDIGTGPGMEAITDLTPLEDLVEVAEFLSIQGSMTTLNGLHNLVSVGNSFTITGANQLTDLTGLTSLQSVGNLHLVGLVSLTSLSGLSSLAAVGFLNLENLPFLTDFSGMPAAVDIETLVITNTQQLTSLDGAPAMSNLRLLALNGNQALNDLNGLSASTFLTDPPDDAAIGITSNNALLNLIGLPAVERIGSLNISGNSALTSLAGLENLVEVWSSLSVQENSFLADCSMLATVLDSVDDGDPGPGDGSNPDDPPDTPGLDAIQIGNNGEAVEPNARCNTIEEILSSVAENTVYEDGFESVTP